MRSLTEILQDQRAASHVIEDDFDAVEFPLERIVLTNPQTYKDIGEEF